MRTLIVSVGGFLSAGFALLGVLVAVMGEGQMPARRGSAPIDGFAVYPMAIAWLALATTIFCISLLMAEVGPKYYIRIVRNWAFFAFAVGLIATLVIAIHKAYGPVAL
jgi:hypothetical protein